MTTAEQFKELAPLRQRHVHFSLCEQALMIWSDYISTHAPLRYVDSVVGMRHDVDVELPADALRSARAGTDLSNVAARYQEPIVALQDDGLTFPTPMEFAYYAIYNCFRKYARAEDIDPWLIVNQALSSDEDPEAWEYRLATAIAASVVARDVR